MQEACLHGPADSCFIKAHLEVPSKTLIVQCTLLVPGSLLYAAVAKDVDQQAIRGSCCPAQGLLTGCCSAGKGDRHIAHAVAAAGHIPAQPQHALGKCVFCM